SAAPADAPRRSMARASRRTLKCAFLPKCFAGAIGGSSRGQVSRCGGRGRHALPSLFFPGPRDAPRQPEDAARPETILWRKPDAVTGKFRIARNAQHELAALGNAVFWGSRHADLRMF